MLKINYFRISKYLIYMCLFYLFFIKYAYRDSHVVLYGTAGLATICMVLDLLVSHKDISDLCHWGLLINLIMCIYSLITGVFVANDTDVLISAIKTYSAFSLICLVICYISKEEKSIIWLSNAIIIIDMISALYVLTNGTYYKGYGYIIGPTQNPNNLGLAMTLGLFCIAYKPRTKPIKTVSSVCISILFLYTIIGCGSRKCVFAAIIVCALWLISLTYELWNGNSWGTRIILILFLVAIAVGLIYYYNNVYINTYSYNRMTSLGAEDEGSSQARILYYQYALDYFQEKPIFGIGLDQFRVWNPHHAYAHSTYAEALAGWGFVGCIFYFFPVVLAGIHLIRRSLFGKEKYNSGVVLALWAAEMFLGIGQIWFYEIEHLIAWAMIYIAVFMADNSNRTKNFRRLKYVKV